MPAFNTQRGFTLIEMLVSTALFTIVVVMALGALLAMSTADRRAEAVKSGIDNLDFGIDSMSRAIRTGYNYHCGSTGVVTTPQDCQTGANYLSFLGINNVQTYYRLDTTNAATCGQLNGTVGCIERSLDGTNWLPITSPDVIIKSTGFLFYVVGSLPGPDTTQPKVVITITGLVQISGTQQSTTTLQSTVTQRIYDQ